MNAQGGGGGGGGELYRYPFFSLGIGEGSTPPPWSLYSRERDWFRRLGGPRGRYGRERNVWLSPGFDPRIVQPVASRYSEYGIPMAFEARSSMNIIFFNVPTR
jgi:hypothetical protein